jgi:hypothetical protein
VRPGPVGRRGLVDAILPRNFVYRPAGANPARPRVSPPEPVASLAPFLETGSAKRRHANVRAVGLRPRNLSSSRMPRVLFFIEGHNGPRRTVGKAGAVSGGVFDHSTHEEDGLVTWEALASPGQMPVIRRAGYPSPTHDTYADARVVGLMRHRTSVRTRVGHSKGNRSGGRRRQGVGGLHRSFEVGERPGKPDPSEQRRPVLM